MPARSPAAPPDTRRGRLPILVTTAGVFERRGGDATEPATASLSPAAARAGLDGPRASPAARRRLATAPTPRRFRARGDARPRRRRSRRAGRRFSVAAAPVSLPAAIMAGVAPLTSTSWIPPTSPASAAAWSRLSIFEARSEPEEGPKPRGGAGGAQPGEVEPLPRTRLCGVRLPEQPTATSACQFTFTCEGKSLRVTRARPLGARQAHRRRGAGGRDPISSRVGGATHYHADYVRPRWASRLLLFWRGPRRHRSAGHLSFYQLAPGAALTLRRALARPAGLAPICGPHELSARPTTPETTPRCSSTARWVLALAHLRLKEPSRSSCSTTHAGIGLTDLASEEALKTREADGGHPARACAPRRRARGLSRNRRGGRRGARRGRVPGLAGDRAPPAARGRPAGWPASSTPPTSRCCAPISAATRCVAVHYRDGFGGAGRLRPPAVSAAGCVADRSALRVSATHPERLGGRALAKALRKWPTRDVSRLVPA